MQYFNFSRLIRKYSRPFTCELKAEGTYDDLGEWVASENAVISMTGAILSVRDDKLYQQDGVYTEKDKILYMLTPIDNAMLGAEIIFKDNVYTVEDSTGADDAEFTGVYRYHLKWVSVFRRLQR